MTPEFTSPAHEIIPISQIPRTKVISQRHLDIMTQRHLKLKPNLIILIYSLVNDPTTSHSQTDLRPS